MVTCSGCQQLRTACICLLNIEQRGTEMANQNGPDGVDPLVVASVLRWYGERVRNGAISARADHSDRHCEWCTKHDGDCDGFHRDEESINADLAAFMLDAAAQQEGRAAYLARGAA